MAPEPIDPELVDRRIRAIAREILEGEGETIRTWVREDVGRALRGASFQPALREAATNLVGTSFEESVRAHLEGSLDKLVRSIVGERLTADPLQQLGRYAEQPIAPPLPPIREQERRESNFGVDPALLERDLESYVRRDPYPIPVPEDREGYGEERHFEYWLTGLQDYLKLKATLRRHGVPVEAPFALLDLGCATGRVLRHFLSQEEGLELWGTDIYDNHALWIAQHLPRDVRVFQCSTLPTLPLPDDHFSAVSAFSVFTHIDELESAWLAELRRVLKPGGIAYLTVHSDRTWASMEPGMGVYDDLLRLAPYITDIVVNPELFQGPMPGDKAVFRWFSTAYHMNVFHSEIHIRRVWGNLFEVLEIVTRGSGYQDVVVLRKEA